MSAIKLAKRGANEFDFENLRIPLELVPPPIGAPPRTGHRALLRQEGRFVIAPLESLIAAGAVLDCPAMLVWLYLLYQARMMQTDTVPVANRTLAEWGVSRFVKARALQKLEAADLIRVNRRDKRSPLVTLLHVRQRNRVVA